MGDGELPDCALPPSHPPALPQSLKPLLEKRRRARINESLSQLKSLVLPLLGAEVSIWDFRRPSGESWVTQRGRWAVGIQRPACDLRAGVVGSTSRLESMWVQERGAQLPGLLWGVSLV